MTTTSASPVTLLELFQEWQADHPDGGLKASDFSSFAQCFGTWFGTAKLQKILHLPHLKAPQLWLSAFIHRSFYHENLDFCPDSYERLEFLGDSVLNLIVTGELLKTYPGLPEGQLSKLRGALVNQTSLYELASSLSLVDYVLIGRGEWRRKGHLRPSLHADILEAVIGVIYLENGLGVATLCFEKLVAHYERIAQHQFYDLKKLEHFDPKTRLQEIILGETKVPPDYQGRILENGKFEVTVSSSGEQLASAISSSKKAAEKLAAQKALEQLER